MKTPDISNVYAWDISTSKATARDEVLFVKQDPLWLQHMFMFIW
jgi:hypothetical protein